MTGTYLVAPRLVQNSAEAYRSASSSARVGRMPLLQQKLVVDSWGWYLILRVMTITLQVIVFVLKFVTKWWRPRWEVRGADR